jgi:hypothetical protein
LGLAVVPVGLPVVEDTRRLVEALLFAGELLGVVVEAGEAVLEPIADVGAVIKLCSVALKVPVIPVRLNRREI